MPHNDYNEYGVCISSSENCKTDDKLIITGEYKIPYANHTVPDLAKLMPKHVVVIVTRGENNAAIKPFKDIVVFEDDVQDAGVFAIGKFNLNIFEHIQFDGVGDYYILGSLGNYLSNIVKVTVS